MTSASDPLKQEILRILAGPKYRPLDSVELGKFLGRKSGVRMNLNQALRELEQAGFAFVTNEQKPGEQDLYISAENTGTAMHGDRVVARITRDEQYARAKG